MREDKDLKQEDVANELEITRQQYQLYESGNREIKFHLVIKLAEFYDVSIDYIAGRTNDKKGLTRSELAKDETALIKAFRSFTERQKGRIEQVVKDIEQEQAQECRKKEA